MISSRKASNVESALATFSEKALPNVHGIACHVAKSEDREKLIDETLKKFGAIDILVSNAGTNPVFGPMLEVNLTRFLRIESGIFKQEMAIFIASNKLLLIQL